VSYEDAPKRQTTCNACLSHRPIRGEDHTRVELRLTDHAERATRILQGALDDNARLKEQLDRFHEGRRDTAASNAHLYSRLEQVALLHGAIGDTRRCACGLAIDKCQTAPLVERYRPRG
jgi:hypothetical protein